MVIAITRLSVETGDTRPLLDKLLPLAASREAARHGEGKLTFFFLRLGSGPPGNPGNTRDPCLLSGGHGGIPVLATLC